MTVARARRRRRRLGGIVLAAAAAAVTLTAPADALLTPPAQSPSDSAVEDSYIVVYKPSVATVRTATDRRQAALGFERQHLYRHAIDGFSATLSPEQVRRLRADPEVDFVSVNRRFEQSEMVALAAGEAVPPTGIRRILAATSTTVRQAAGVGVAVIDSGIDLANSDLNAAHGTNCTDPGSPAQDAPDGHGTHVAGTIGARNNGAGVTGVAPGTRMYAVKVFDDAGRGSTATALCGLEWVTANSSALNIRVANLSFGNSEGDPVRPCRSTTDALHRAICSSTAAGVHHVVAAGNDAVGFDHSKEPTVPAAYPQVLTVTAVSDGDGSAGGSGAPACRPGDADESAASFSNAAITAQGAAHTIAAPGVCITSTLPGGGYRTLSGTSFAAPHVAGLVALCINENGAPGPCTGKTAAQVVDHMRSDAETYNRANPGYGFAGDPLRPAPNAAFYGFLARAPAPAVDAPPPAAQPGGAPSPAAAPAPPPPPLPRPAPAPRPTAGDTAAPSASLSGSVSQKLRGAVAFTLSCPAEPCRATTTGRTGVPKLGRMKARTYRLKAVTTAIAKGAKATVKVKLGGSARARIRRALRAGKPISVQLSVRVAGSTGTGRTLHRQISLRL